ncbi:mucin-2-like, partial [Penaeus indicus]|uniref:mucin-2-like n=1 Tax=Penaeus indicus TaxID=29960 RepID=UPI00300C59B2
ESDKFTRMLLWMMVTMAAGATGFSSVGGPPVHEDLLAGGVQQVSVLNVRSLLDLPFFNSPDSQVFLVHPPGFAPRAPPSQASNQHPPASPSSHASSPHITPAVLVASNVPSHVPSSGTQPRVSPAMLPNMLSDISSNPIIDETVDPSIVLLNQPQAPIPNTLTPIPVIPETLTHTTARSTAVREPAVAIPQPSIPVSESPASQPPFTTPHALPATSQSTLVSFPSQIANSFPQHQSSASDASVSTSSDVPQTSQLPASASLPPSIPEQSTSASHQQNDVSLNPSTEAQLSLPNSSPPSPVDPLAQEKNFIHQPVIPTPQLLSSTSLPLLPSQSSPLPSLSVNVASSSQLSLSQELASTPASSGPPASPAVASNRILQVDQDRSVNALPSGTSPPPSLGHLEIAHTRSSISPAITQQSPPEETFLDSPPVTSAAPPVSTATGSMRPTILDNEVSTMPEGLAARHPVRLIMPGAEEVTARRLATQARRDSMQRSTTVETTSATPSTVAQKTTPTAFLSSTIPGTTPRSSTTSVTTSTASAPTAPPSVATTPSTASTPQALPDTPQQETAPSSAHRITSLDPLTSLFLSVSRSAVQNVESAAFSHFHGQRPAAAPVPEGTPEVP